MRTLLVVTARFHPDRGVGAIRATEWARLLPELGWDVVALGRNYGVSLTPRQLASEVHPRASVRWLPVRRPASLSRRAVGALVTKLIGTVAVPDPADGVWRGARDLARALANEVVPDVVLTTSPPHSVHRLGLYLQEQLGCGWVADFRDPYLLDPRYRPSGVRLMRRRTHVAFENSIYERADLVLHANPVHHALAVAARPAAAGRMRLHMNGYPDDLLALERAPGGTEGTVVASVGAVGAEPLGALARAIERVNRGGARLRLVIAGQEPKSARPSLRRLGSAYSYAGVVPHRAALQVVRNADVLFLGLDEHRSRVRGLSSKLFEYLAMPVPVIAVAPCEADRRLLAERDGVVIIDQPDDGRIADALAAVRAGELTPTEHDVAAFRAQFSRRRSVMELAGALDELVERRGSGRR